MRAWIVMAALSLGAASASEAYAASKPAKVSFVQGNVDVLRGAARHTKASGRIPASAPWKTLKKGQSIREGDAIRTGKKSRVELKVADGSRVRLGASSQVTLARAQIEANETRKVTFRMWAGRLWANVAKRLGATSQFEVKTQNAVAGVRGTSFAVMAQADMSSVVKVYIGSVGVKAKPGGDGRKQIPGPHRIDKAQWEEVILTAMKQVRIGRLGQIQPAEDLLDEGSDARLAQWNQARDAKTP